MWAVGLDFFQRGAECQTGIKPTHMLPLTFGKTLRGVLYVVLLFFSGGLGAAAKWTWSPNGGQKHSSIRSACQCLCLNTNAKTEPNSTSQNTDPASLWFQPISCGAHPLGSRELKLNLLLRDQFEKPILRFPSRNPSKTGSFPDPDSSSFPRHPPQAARPKPSHAEELGSRLLRPKEVCEALCSVVAQMAEVHQSCAPLGHGHGHGHLPVLAVCFFLDGGYFRGWLK